MYSITNFRDIILYSYLYFFYHSFKIILKKLVRIIVHHLENRRNQEFYMKKIEIKLFYINLIYSCLYNFVLFKDQIEYKESLIMGWKYDCGI